MNNHFSISEVFGRVFSIYGRRFRSLASLSLAVFVPTAIIWLIGATTLGIAEDLTAGLAILTLLMLSIAVFFYAGAVVRVAEEDVNGVVKPTKELLASVVPVTLPLVGLSLIAYIGVSIGFALFIIPGVYLMVAWSLFAPSVVVERTGFGALKRSRKLVSGHFSGVLIALILLAVLNFIIWIALSIVVSVVQSVLGNSLGWAVMLVAWGMVLAPINGLTLAIVFFELREIKEGPATAVPPTAPLGAYQEATVSPQAPAN